MQKITLARNAMATRFEFVLLGENPVALQAAGDEALDEIERIESQLSLYRSSSEVAAINSFAAQQPVRVSPAVFQLLDRARRISESTSGAFDPSVGPLSRCWGFMKGSGELPGDPDIAAARDLVGFDKIELNASASTVRFLKPGMMIDLGSIGKGYALDLAAEILRDAGVENALLHGGTSTIIGMGEQAKSIPWRVAVEGATPPDQSETPVLGVVELRNQALSVSAVWGKSFELDGQLYGHVIDPRTGRPARHGLLAAVIHPSAAESDALSTAILLSNPAELGHLERVRPDLRYLRLDPDEKKTFRWDESSIA